MPRLGVDLRWTDGAVAVTCPVCRRHEGQVLLALAPVDWRPDPVKIARCVGCAAIVMSDVLPPTDFFAEEGWDAYLEHAAGLEVIARLLTAAGDRPSGRMLDIGCGYGFALDLGSFLFDWQGVGLDPSVAAERGRTELGLDIRSGLLSETIGPGERFDVIFSSEVLEHVPDPRAFLTSIAGHLSEDGIVLLTTPNADAITPETAPAELIAALSIGAHTFLVSPTGLEELLRSVGLDALVWAEGPSLRAVAARSPAALSGARPDADFAFEDLVRYTEYRAGLARAGSALQVGMAARHLKYCVNLGDLDRARDHLPNLRAAMAVRHGYDIDAPGAPLPPTGRGVLVGIHYFMGIMALNGGGGAVLAERHFAAAARSAATIFRADGEYRHPEITNLEFHALGHRAITLAFQKVKPRRIRQALSDVDLAVARGAGNDEQALIYRARVAEIAADLGSEPGFVARTRDLAARIASRVKREWRG